MRLALLGSSLLCCYSIVIGCAGNSPSFLDIVLTVPPSATLAPSDKFQTPLEKTAWLKKVEIADSDLGNNEMKASLENTLTNNLLKYLQEGNYFKKIEALPGQPLSEDYILQYRFDRYRVTKRIPPQPAWNPTYAIVVSEYSATLKILNPDGHIITEVSSLVEDKHRVMENTVEANNGLKPRSDFIGMLLRKGLSATKPTP